MSRTRAIEAGYGRLRGASARGPAPAVYTNWQSALVAERRWLPAGVSLLKRVGAVAGDMVCVDAVLQIRGELVGPILAEDAQGRPLPLARRGCFTIAPGFFFPVSRSTPLSFDGRYFGAVPVRDVIAEVVPLWTSSRAR